MASTAGSLLMLLVVLAAIPLVLYALKRIQTFRPPGSVRALEVTAQVALGARERVVMVRMNDRVLVLGVTPQQITLLAETDPAPLPPPGAVPANAAPTFTSLLRQSLGLRDGDKP